MSPRGQVFLNSHQILADSNRHAEADQRGDVHGDSGEKHRDEATEERAQAQPQSSKSAVHEITKCL